MADGLTKEILVILVFLCIVSFFFLGVFFLVACLLVAKLFFVVFRV